MTQIRQTKPRLTDDPTWTGWAAFHAAKKAEREAVKVHDEKQETFVK